MDDSNNLWHHELLDELADRQAAYIANALKGPVHVSVHLAAYILALEAHRSGRLGGDCAAPIPVEVVSGVVVQDAMSKGMKAGGLEGWN